MGRLGDAKRAVELLTCEEIISIKEFAYILNHENTNRREIDKSITEDAFRFCDENSTSQTAKLLSLFIMIAGIPE